MTRLAAAAGLLLLALEPGPRADDYSTAFLTEPQANAWAMPSDSPTVAVSSADGRYVAFVSYARLVEADANDYGDIYVLDRVSRQVTLETRSGNRPGDPVYATPRLSGDGRLLLYDTASVTEATRVLVLRDRRTGDSRIIGPGGEAANGPSRHGAISTDGRTVVFTSAATNLVAGEDANGSGDDVYSYDVGSAAFSRVSLAANGQQLPAGASFTPSVSADGRFVAFSSTAPLDGRASPGRGPRPLVNVFLRDRKLATTLRVSAGRDGALLNGSSFGATVSGDGRYVAFVSEASNLVRSDTNRAPDIFLFDSNTGSTELVSRSEAGIPANGASTEPAISDSGMVVTFQSDASDLVCARQCPAAMRDINLVADIFAFDRRTRALRRISTGRAPWIEPSIGPAIDGTGAVIAFSSRHPRDSGDDSDDYDLFVAAPIK